MATFNTTRNWDSVPLSPGQKSQLFFKSASDPWPFFLTGVVAGIGQAEDSYSEWGQGLQCYAKRYGAAYIDYFIGNFSGTQYYRASCMKTRGTFRRERVVSRRALYGRQQVPSGAGATMARGGRITRTWRET
jgi:hypothetical protein